IYTACETDLKFSKGFRRGPSNSFGKPKDYGRVLPLVGCQWANSAATSSLRNLAGRRLLYTIGQYGGGYRFFVFDDPDGFLARPAGQLTAKGETWAWDIAANGDIWHGDSPGNPETAPG
ncbi:MAG: hypothetical protein ABSF95_20820, partial [Verrucomicrobiota bacterium]